MFQLTAFQLVAWYDDNTTSNGDNKFLWDTLHARQSPQSFMCSTPYIFYMPPYKAKWEVKATQSCLSPPGSYVHGISQDWSRLPSPSPGDLSDLGVTPRFPKLQADPLLSKPPGKPSIWSRTIFNPLLHMGKWELREVQSHNERCSLHKRSHPWGSHPWKQGGTGPPSANSQDRVSSTDACKVVLLILFVILSCSSHCPHWLLSPGQSRCELRGWKEARGAVGTTDTFMLSWLTRQP